ncbi:hypothetical protein DL95DRAFT_501604 [Leptodontidium sp. 2 PMI_412]|nr:hypothetical protein DL95DRAFT_501604 [Leptodontidium sp. 2 PMI_412]
MFSQRLHQSSLTGRRATKSKSSFREHVVSKNRQERSLNLRLRKGLSSEENTLTLLVITIIVGRERRLFAAHENVLYFSLFF